MVIVKRIIGCENNILGYLVEDDNGTDFITASTAISLKSEITNAHLSRSGVFVANSGEHIETILIDNSVSIKQTAPMNKEITGSGNFDRDYYGKDFINVCRRIRKLAQRDSLVVDMGKHRSNDGYNTQLFKLIETCGTSVKDFVRGYLSVLQPYSLSRFSPNTHIDKNNYWVSDVGYGVSLVIKIDGSDENKPLVVSFHESNNRGIYLRGANYFTDKPCAVLVKDVKMSKYEDGYYDISYYIQRGFMCLEFSDSTRYYNNGVALINYNDIAEDFILKIQDIIHNIALTYSDTDVLSHLRHRLGDLGLHELSFMSIGYNKTNNICLLIDLYAKYTDTRSRTAFVTLAVNILSELPTEMFNSMKLALKERYTRSTNKLYLTIMGIER